MSDATINGHAPKLFDPHLAELRRSGLSDQTIKDAGIYSEHDARKLAEHTHRRSWPQAYGHGLVFPYFNSDGTRTLSRVKPERPPERNGRSQKYISPTGIPSRVYFALDAHKRMADGETLVVIVEGEKKALAGGQAGYCCLSIPGVCNWHSKKSTSLHPDLARYSWAGRKVYIVFDSDWATNADVRKNALLLAARLQSLGAVVKMVWLPAADAGSKVGLDDYLVAHDVGEFQRLLDKAEDPEELPPELEKAEAFLADPADVATKFRESISIEAQPRIRFHQGEWYYWERGAYRILNGDDLAAKVLGFFRRDYYQVKRENVANVLMHLKSQCLVGAHVEIPTWLDRESTDWPALECVSTKSGIVHLRSYAARQDCLRSATPRFFTTAAVTYSFDHEAGPPIEWMKFLLSLWADDGQSIQTLCEFFGYCLTQDTSQQKLLMIVGPKRSGKGTILRILRSLVGAMNVAAPTLSSLAERFGLWPLLGKPVAVVSDARLSGRVDQAVIVERILSITGEDAQTVDRKNLQPVTLKLPTRFVIVTNELPRLGDSSGALVSRMLLLRTTNSFYGCEDHGLTDRLLAELPGIFLWAVGGWQSLNERGRFIQPDSSLELLNELNDLSSPIGAFVRERCGVDPVATVAVDVLYAEWRRWCESGGKVRPTDKATFGRDLGALLPTVRRARPVGEDGQREYVYAGIELSY